MKLFLRRGHGITGCRQRKRQAVLFFLPAQLKGNPFSGSGLFKNRFCFLPVPDLLHLRFCFPDHLCSRLFKPLQIFAEIQSPAPFVCFRRIGIGTPGLLEIQNDRCIHADRRQLFAHNCHIIMLPKSFPGPFLPDLFHMGVSSFDVSISRNQRSRTFFSDPRNSRNVVGRIAHQRFQLDNLGRRDLISIYHILCVIILNLCHPFAGLGHPDHNLVCGNLQKIPVSGYDHRLKPFCLTFSGRSTQQIVCLIPLLHEQRDVHGLQKLLEHRNLLPQFMGHLFSCPFVCLVHLMPESRRA